MIKYLNLVKEKTEKSQETAITPEELSGITNSYVENIDCICLDEFMLQDRINIFNMAVSKICVGGKLSLKCMNINLLGSKINKAEITGEKLSELLPKINSMWSDHEISHLINQHQLLVKGMNNDNFYTVYQLEKA